MSLFIECRKYNKAEREVELFGTGNEGHMDRYVNSIQDIIDNANTLDQYLQSDEERGYALDRIRLGICFVVMKNNEGELRFYPSKFVGYRNNNRNLHQEEIRLRNGMYTNKRITRLLNGENPKPLIYESEYKRFCLNELNVDPPLNGAFGCSHKYWEMVIDNH